MSVGLKDLREFYGKLSRMFNFMSMLFLVVIAGLGIYVAEIMNEAEADSNKVFGLYTVFVVGIILSLLLIIGCLMGRKGESEAALRLRRVLSILVFVVGGLSLVITASTVIETYSEWDDAYTTAIFTIQLVASILVELFCVLTFLTAFYGCKYYDSKKNAKDIPKECTKTKLSGRYLAGMGFSYFILSVSVFLMSYYFWSEIRTYIKINIVADDGYGAVFYALFVIGMITSVLVLLPSAVAFFVQNKIVYTVNKITYLLNTLTQAVFVVCSVLIMQKGYVKSAHPDLAYIIFSIVLVAMEAFIFVKAEKTLKKSV